jgi:hypothetical protein
LFFYKNINLPLRDDTSKNFASSSPPGVKSLAVTDLAGQSRQAKSDFSRCPVAQVLQKIIASAPRPASQIPAKSLAAKNLYPRTRGAFF